jgi:broad specificity phosphatase PhoE
MKTINFLRHYHLQPPYDNYDKLSYQQLQDLGLEKVSPSIQDFDQQTINFINTLKAEKPELILHTPSIRSQQTAEQIIEHLDPSIPHQATLLLHEIPFDLSKLITKEQFKKDGLSQLRSSFYSSLANDHTEESFTDLYQRLMSLKQYLHSLPQQNIISISHGFFLVTAKLFFENNLSRESLINLKPIKIDYLSGFKINI